MSELGVERFPRPSTVRQIREFECPFRPAGRTVPGLRSSYAFPDPSSSRVQGV